MEYDIAIIGSGLAGGSMAAALARRGWRVLLVEKRAQAQHKVCGEFLSPESQASFRALGVYDAVAPLQPEPMRAARLVSRRGVALLVPLPGTAWGISRYALDTALSTAASDAGADVWLGTSAAAVTATTDGYRLDLRGPHDRTQVNARAVVAACGRHPVQALRPAAHTADAAQTYVGVKCHYQGVTMPAEVQIYLFDGGYAGLGPVEHGRVNLCMLVRRETFAQAGANVPAMIAHALGASPALARVLADGNIVPGTCCAVAPVDTERTPVPWDGYARVGDAVAMIPPLCGDGMAMALRGAEICASTAHEFLNGSVSVHQWQQRYTAAWHTEFDSRLRLGRHLQRVLAVPLLNDALLGAGHAFPQLAERLVRATRG